MANLCIKTPSSASLVLIFQLLVLRPRPSKQKWPCDEVAAFEQNYSLRGFSQAKEGIFVKGVLQ